METQQPNLTPEKLAALRKPFPQEQVSRRPTISCRDCRNSPSKVCPNHQKIRCDATTGCGQYITSAHFHLDYVGHADVTDRLLDIDPDWNWEPLAVDENGLPRFDRHDGLWMKLTICDKTVLCYGSAPGKTGADAIKEVIGDGIRNGAMRFGVALDLWNGKFAKMAENLDLDNIPEELAPLAAKATIVQFRRIKELWSALGFIGDINQETRIKVASHIIGREIDSEQDLTCDEAVALILALEARIKEKKAKEVKEDKASKTSKTSKEGK